jgi:hypothetical protein
MVYFATLKVEWRNHYWSGHLVALTDGHSAVQKFLHLVAPKVTRRFTVGLATWLTRWQTTRLLGRLVTSLDTVLVAKKIHPWSQNNESDFSLHCEQQWLRKRSLIGFSTNVNCRIVRHIFVINILKFYSILYYHVFHPSSHHSLNQCHQNSKWTNSIFY